MNRFKYTLQQYNTKSTDEYINTTKDNNESVTVKEETVCK